MVEIGAFIQFDYLVDNELIQEASSMHLLGFKYNGYLNFICVCRMYAIE